MKALREFGSFDSFKVHAKRSNTDYELTSIDINRQVGEVLCEAFPDKKVQMHDPDAMVHVLVVQGSVYVYARSERGVGGLPVGSAGKVVTLLSSGIDSPVATWMLARRGAVCVPVHFSGRPQTPDTSEYLVQDIIRALEPGVQIGRLYVVPFGDCQREISVTCPSNLRVIMYRRIMYSVAERIAHIEGAKAIVTGRIAWTGCLPNAREHHGRQRVREDSRVPSAHRVRQAGDHRARRGDWYVRYLD